jgi:hypothetical protein
MAIQQPEFTPVWCRPRFIPPSSKPFAHLDTVAIKDAMVPLPFLLELLEGKTGQPFKGGICAGKVIVGFQYDDRRLDHIEEFFIWGAYSRG